MEYRQPFEGTFPITQDYGEKITSDFHTGIDYGCPIGTPILASNDGTVVFAGWDKTGYGSTVILRHKDGNGTLYAHLALIDQSLEVAKTIKRGRVIGYSGSTGNSTGAHLHFEARTQALNYKTHFNPKDLPLVTSWEPMQGNEPEPLTGADKLGTTVEIAAPLGAKAFSKDFQKCEYYPQGAAFTFTGKTQDRNGYTYCECTPVVSSVWIAVNDGDTQILK